MSSDFCLRFVSFLQDDPSRRRLPPTAPAVLMCPLEGVLPMLDGSFPYALDVGAPVLEIQSPGVSERRMPNTKGSRQTRNAR
jgi:hypothetical protein